jgi:hypothetical protein
MNISLPQHIRQMLQGLEMIYYIWNFCCSVYGQSEEDENPYQAPEMNAANTTL